MTLRYITCPLCWIVSIKNKTIYQVHFICDLNQHRKKKRDLKYKLFLISFLIFIKTIQTFVVSYKRAKWLFWRSRSEPDLSGLYPGPGNPCFQSQFFIGPRIFPISSAKPTERVLYLHIIYKRAQQNVKT